MGKKRITDMSGGKTPQKEKTDEKARTLVKSGKQHGRVTDMGAIALAEAEEFKKKESELEKLTKKKAKEEKKAKKTSKNKKKRSQKYLKAKKHNAVIQQRHVTW